MKNSYVVWGCVWGGGGGGGGVITSVSGRLVASFSQLAVCCLCMAPALSQLASTWVYMKILDPFHEYLRGFFVCVSVAIIYMFSSLIH